MSNEPNEASHQGLACFIDQRRNCGPDCMSFLPEVERPTDRDYIGKQWASCHLLVNVHRAGKHLTVLASCGDQIVKQVKNTAADQKRSSQTLPPTPR